MDEHSRDRPRQIGCLVITLGVGCAIVLAPIFVPLACWGLWTALDLGTRSQSPDWVPLAAFGALWLLLIWGAVRLVRRVFRRRR